MTKPKVAEKITKRGKPLGTRQKDGLYTKILELLQQDKAQEGDGYTAFAISSYLGETHQTVQQYLSDLVEMKKVRQKKIFKMLLFSIK
jgi:lipoate synthase